MRRDLPYILSGFALGVLLLGNSVLAPDAAPVHAVDVALILAMTAALAVCRRYPVVALFAVTAAMLALHVRVHPGVSAAFPVLGAVYVAAWQGHRLTSALASVVFLVGFLAHDIRVAPADRPAQLIAERTSLLLGWFV
ncbi:sensor histidine kinase, partial [Micromonospora azadirachtae]